jgi:hypothetical protein
MSGTIIKIKYSGATPAPTDGDLAVGELAYSFKASTGDRLYIGDNTSGTNTNLVIGGTYFTSKLDHALGTLTANSAILVDASSKINVLNVDNITLDLNTISTTNANGHLILNPNGSGDVQVQATTLAVTGNLTVSGTTTTTGGSTLGNINIAGNTISATNTNGDITLTPNGTGDVIISSAQTLMLPKGGDIGAVAADNGKIRYNTTDNRFEGVVSGNWTGLGGVVDLDQDTKIIVEQASDDDTIRFFAAGTQEAYITNAGMYITDQITAPIGNIATANVTTKLNVTADADFSAGIDVLAGDVDIAADLHVDGHTFLGNSATDHTIVSGNLTVEGTTTSVNSTVTTINDPVVKVGDGSAAGGDALDRGISLDWGDGSAVKTGFFGMDMQTKRFSFKKDIGATDNQEYSAPWGDADFGSMYLSGSATIGTTLAVTGNATVGGTLGVTGIGTFGNNITVAGTTLSTGNLTVGASKFVVTAGSGNTAIAGTLAVTGLTTVGGTLGVTGVTTLAALLNANGGIAVATNKFTVATSGNIVSAGTMTIAGATVLSTTLNGQGAVDFDTTLNVDGAVTLKSTTALGSSGQMAISAAGVMTAGTIDCGTF